MKKALFSFFSSTPISRSECRNSDRILEIDITKGIAGFLMLLAHLASAQILPFGTFAAPLFFFCSGMNTVLSLEKNKPLRGFPVVQFIFPVILFFGGYTQIVIAHGAGARFGAEFLQFSALAILMVLLLRFMIASYLKISYLFPIPFLIQQLLPNSLLANASMPWNPFVISGTAYSLIPWFGYFLFGIFILKHRQNPKILGSLILIFLLSASLSTTVFHIPIQKFWTSPSYIFLSLLTVTGLFLLSHPLSRDRAPLLVRVLRDNLALIGRNSIMFIFFHYFTLNYLITKNLLSNAILLLTVESLYLALICLVFLKFYEEIKYDWTLFYPSLLLFLLLTGIRYANMFKARMDLRLIDIIIGMLFAFLYIQFRKKIGAVLSQRKD